MNIRRHGARFAWLMIGAAIGTTVVLVLSLVGLVRLELPLPLGSLAAGVLVGVLLGGVLGLVPGVRELEVTGARSMLGVRRELIVPQRPRLLHRLQDVLWVQLHLLAGLLVAACLTMLMPVAVLTLIEAVRGAENALVPTADSALGRLGIAAAALATILFALTAAGPIGALAAHLAPRLLGPTSRDRLDVALARAAQEAEHTRIARELHDGIGHALTIVSIQAAAGGRVIDQDAAAAAQALARIESTAREALAELDQVLADLRDEGADETGPAEASGAAGSTRDPGSPPAAELPLETRLHAVLEDHRRAGMDLHADLTLPRDLPVPQHEHLARIVTELLTNAHRHGGPGPVLLQLHEEHGPTGERATVIRCENRRAPASAHTTGGGRGLAGLRERLDLWGGTLDAGPADAARTWRTRAVLPLLPERSD
ncbi:MAG: histidine kinase [Brachybacterium sp.]|uniref:sensor histidine kinase n=1 Tax=Brachybacterium sp. TaxID=1891286 RepID=UPI002648A6FE|nr:histidine kinase [Brachybacterium sp.]MDN5686634.1 histidine kinase [Brachybacterium sp.]